MANKTSKSFRAWRRRLGLTQNGAAAKLGVTAMCVYIYDNGKRYSPDRDIKVPLAVRLACSAIENNLPPIGGE